MSGSKQSLCSGPSVWQLFLTKKEADEDTPSRKDGMPKSIEDNHRKFYVGLIADICSKFSTRPDLLFVASLYCHRFYAARSMVQNDRLTVVTAAVFLAFKVADVTHPFKMVMERAYSLYKRIPREEAAKILSSEEYYKSLKAKVLTAERSIMYVIGFDFKPDLPARHYFGKIKTLTHLSEQDRHTLKQLCVNFANDMLGGTTLFLRYSAKELGYAFLYLTLKFAGLSALPDTTADKSSKEWYEADGIMVERMTEVTQSIMDSMEEQAKMNEQSNKQAKSERKRKQGSTLKPSSCSAGDAEGRPTKKHEVPAKDA